ncbi:Ras family [Phytophthora infestans]|nr:Ras family [Phytophthora infestans]KAF4137371.1 Ras family [Phytophthora infestans]
MPSSPKKKKCESYKVIVLGDSGVGKSSLVRRMTNSGNLTGTAIRKDYLSKIALVEGASAPLQVQLWDTAGQEKFGAARLPSSFFRLADAALVVYDVTNRQSFISLLQWVLQIQTYRSTEPADSNFSFVLIGHKCDLANATRQVSENVGRGFGNLIAASHFFECSSEDGTNLQECFDAIAVALSNGTPWTMSNVPLPRAMTLETRGSFRLAAPSSGVDVTSPISESASARSPTLKALSANTELSIVGKPYIGTLAVLLSMPMVLLWLDDDALLHWADAFRI